MFRPVNNSTGEQVVYCSKAFGFAVLGASGLVFKTFGRSSETGPVYGEASLIIPRYVWIWAGGISTTYHSMGKPMKLS